jgi:hypothetical protein
MFWNIEAVGERSSRRLSGGGCAFGHCKSWQIRPEGRDMRAAY